MIFRRRRSTRSPAPSPAGPTGFRPFGFSTIAIFFILIDIELLFIWPWAMLYRQLGGFGFVAMLVFLAVLMFGFLYIVRKGGLEWE